MNPLPDNFETMLIRKVFLWSCTLFIALFAATLLSQFSFDGFEQPALPFLIIVRSGALLFNVAILIWLSRSVVPESFFVRAPLLVTSVNFVLSLLAIIGPGGNSLVSMGSYLVFSMLYLMIFGFFNRNQFFTACLGLFLMGAAVVLFIIFPERFFRQRLDIEEIRSVWNYVISFGLVLATLLVTFSNHITNLIIARTRETAERLRAMAFFDHSTGFPNGLQMEQDMQSFDEIPKIKLPAGKLVMIGFRLEGLEALNETRGLAFTDSLVRDIARAYRLELESLVATHPEIEFSGSFESMYRVESNSFMYVVKMPHSNQVTLSSKSILASMIEKVVLEQQCRINLSFQGGFSIYPDDADTIVQLFRNLLNLLHSRKNESLGQFICFNPDHYLEFLRQEQVRSHLADALRDGEFRLVYQPKIEVATGRVRGFEALARWLSPVYGEIVPAEFIPLAEQNGTIGTLTLDILAMAYVFVRTLRDENHSDISVSVNLSPGLLNPEFMDRIIDDIEKNGLGPSLELEITEGVLMKLNPLISAKFNRLKQFGVGFSIDDFGTGYSNLGYLQNFEADVLKIDKRFIDGIPADGKNSKLVEAIMQMARSFNMLVVAEGVEYREQRDFLFDHGCDQIQGYFYSKPLPGEDALKFVSLHT